MLYDPYISKDERCLMDYKFHVSNLLMVDCDVLTPGILLELKEQLMTDYHASGSYVDTSNGNGGVTRNLITPFNASLFKCANECDELIAYMQANNIGSAKILGNFLSRTIHLPSKGEQVVIPKGIEVKSTLAKMNKPNGVKRTVGVHSINRGFIISEWGQIRISNAFATWVGSGGYWCHTSLDNIEKL